MTQPGTMPQLPALGGTGLVSHLYEYLWTKNNLLQTRCMYHKCPPVLIPDTILLKNKQPTAWYFSSLKTGSLQRRSKDLSVSKVVEALVRRQDPNTDIVATFVGSAQGKATLQLPCACTRPRASMRECAAPPAAYTDPTLHVLLLLGSCRTRTDLACRL